MNKINYIKTGNAPPVTRQKVKGKRQKLKGKSQKAKVERQKSGVLSTECTLNFEPGTLNLPERARLLLKMRDGPPGCQPATGVPVSLINKSSVKLCEFSVASVVKKKINHQEPPGRHREHGVKTLAFCYYCSCIKR